MDPEFFSLKPFPDKREDNDISYSPIGSAITYRHTHTHKHPITLDYRYVCFQESDLVEIFEKIGKIADLR